MSVTSGLERLETGEWPGIPDCQPSLKQSRLQGEILPQKIEEDPEHSLPAYAHTAYTEHKHTKKRRTNRSCAVKYPINDQWHFVSVTKEALCLIVFCCACITVAP